MDSDPDPVFLLNSNPYQGISPYPDSDPSKKDFQENVSNFFNS
jgi:hypothetical protein